MKITINVHIYLNDNEIPRVDKTKFLGVYVDSKLSWKYHIAEVEKKVSKNTGIIRKFAYFLPVNIQRILYCTLILPYLSYCNIVWGNTFESNLKRLRVYQNHIIRHLCNVRNVRPGGIRTDTLFNELKLLRLKDITDFQLGLFMYKCTHNLLPDHLCHLFEKNSEHHKYETRSSPLIHIPKHKKILFQHTVRFSGPKIWNSLSPDLKAVPSLNLFKQHYKSSFFLK